MKFYEFNSAPGRPLVNLACANGFLPQVYVRALQPLFGEYHVVSLYARPMWDNCPPESLIAWPQLGDDLLAGLEPLTDQPAVGIGHSSGGIATLYAAIKRPERFSRLVLLDPTLLPPYALRYIHLLRLLGRGDRLLLVQGALRRRRAWDSTEAAFASFRQKSLFKRWPDDVLRAYVESMTTPDNESDSNGKVHLTYSPEWEAQIYRTIDLSVWKLPAKITHPTLLIRGELSDTFTETSERLFRKLNPHVQIVTVRGAGHLVPQEQPGQVGKLIADFLRAG
jgi:pimeloyl-ACP methyl ester carboxylesterase